MHNHDQLCSVTVLFAQFTWARDQLIIYNIIIYVVLYYHIHHSCIVVCFPESKGPESCTSREQFASIGGFTELAERRTS